MWPNPQETADFVLFTEEIRNGKLHFLCTTFGLWRHNADYYFKILKEWSQKHISHLNTYFATAFDLLLLLIHDITLGAI